MPVALPDLQVVVDGGANGKRILNGIGQHAVCDTIRWSSIMNGGHHTFECRISDAERSANTGVYRYGATVTLRQAPATGQLAESGQIFWQGYLRTPIPSDDGRCQLLGNGWHQLLQERDEALLWQDRYYGDWQPADADGFALGMNSPHIDASVNSSALVFNVPKGTDVNNNNKARLVWYYADPLQTRVLPRVVAGTIYKSSPVPTYQDPTLGTTPKYELHLERFDSPTVGGGNGITVNNYNTFLNNNNTDDTGSDFTTTVAQGTLQAPNPHPVISFGLFSNWSAPNSSGTSETFRVRLGNLRVSDLATSDSYVASQVITDLATNTAWGLGFAVGSKVTTTTQNMMPLFWTNGTWWDLMEYLASAEAFKWAIWEPAVTNPEIEFRAWGTATVWTANAYTGASTVISQLSPDDEKYNVVDVAYTKGQNPRVRHVRVGVSPDPFAGLTPPRTRTFKYVLQDPQPDSTLATSIATKLAAEYGTEQYSGTIQASYLTTSGVDHSIYECRAGDQLTLLDFPGGAQTVRIYGVDHADNAPSTLQIGRVPSTLARLLFFADLKRKRKGLIQG